MEDGVNQSIWVKALIPWAKKCSLLLIKMGSYTFHLMDMEDWVDLIFMQQNKKVIVMSF